MTDTIKLFGHGAVASGIPIRRNVTIGEHVRLWHDGAGFWRAEVELPKLMPAGHNGQLIADPEELAEAWHRFMDILRAAGVDVDSGCQIARLDIAWQWQAPAATIITALQWVKHPVPRRAPALWPDGRQCAYGTSGSGWQLVLYAKAAGVLRAELRLGKRHLAKRVDVSAPPDFDRQWQALQGALAPLTPVQLPAENRHSFAVCVAKLPPEHRAAFVANYQHGRTSRQVQTFAAAVASAAVQATGFRLASLIGADGQPPAPCHAPAPKPRGQGRRFGQESPTPPQRRRF